MMSDDRPRLTEGGSDAARLLHASARRRAVAIEDLFLPDRLRLTEQQRVTARALLDKAVRAVEDELRAGLARAFAHAEALHAALSSAHVEIAGPLLAQGSALQDAELVAILLRRSEEHRLLAAAGGASLLLDLASDPEAGIAQDAMAVLVGQSRRFDRFQEPALARTELPADVQHRLVWAVAAALRTYMTSRHGVAEAAADAAIGEAAERLLAAYDEGDGLEARALRLVRRMDAAGRLDRRFIVRALLEGSLTLFIAALSVRTALGPAVLSDLLLDFGDGPVFVLRAAGLEREQAAAVLLRLGGAADRRLDRFDLLSVREAEDGLTLWRSDPAYRAALVRLGEPA